MFCNVVRSALTEAFRLKFFDSVQVPSAVWSGIDFSKRFCKCILLLRVTCLEVERSRRSGLESVSLVCRTDATMSLTV